MIVPCPQVMMKIREITQRYTIAQTAEIENKLTLPLYPAGPPFFYSL